MTDQPDCARCRRIESAIERGLSRHAAREENGWDECSRDDCPMLPRPYSLKTCRRAARGLALTPFATKGDPCIRNRKKPIDNFFAMNWSCCAASASRAAAPRRACRFFDVPGSSASRLAAIRRQHEQSPDPMPATTIRACRH